MKLIRFGDPGKEHPGLLLSDGTRIDASAFGSDYNESFFASDGIARLRDWAAKNAASAPRVNNSVRLGAPICRPSKIVCIGLNFRDHAAETGAKIPTEPVIFFKSTTALQGPNDSLMIPKGADKVDWEVEFAIIIGKRVNYVEKSEALNYVAGYALHNDYSERGFQKDRGGQWVKGKSCDTFAPLGPFLATQDEIADIGNLKMWLKVNGVMRQNSSTANMIFDAAFLVSYVSQFMTLLPGDLISTGTPAGVALGMKTPEYLKPGDVVELGIESLGESRQQVVEFSEAHYAALAG
jgi:2,4-diketo-3-deoxy-L-fuconate hydrolase